MELPVSVQATQALASLCAGVLAGLFYDFLRVVRRHVPGRAMVGLTDALFCLVCTALLFSVGYVFGGGKQRIFMSVLSVLGGVLYFCTLSRLTVGLCEFLYRMVRFAFRILVFPAVWAGKVFKKTRLFLKKLFLYRKKWYTIKYTHYGAAGVVPRGRKPRFPKEGEHFFH